MHVMNLTTPWVDSDLNRSTWLSGSATDYRAFLIAEVEDSDHSDHSELEEILI